jgi:plasmid stabilization system protein ParE
VGTKYEITYTDQIFEDFADIPVKPALVIIDRIDHLKVFPEMGTPVQDPRWKGYRYLVVKNHVVFYVVNLKRKTVNIQFIKHGRMMRPH